MKLYTLLFSAVFAFASVVHTSLAVDELVDPWTPGSPYEDLTMMVGDTITFAWTGTHNVYLLYSDSCDSNGALEIGTASPTTYTFVDADAAPEGTEHYFFCAVGGHCAAGKWA
jgi:plastocyanin